MARDELDWRKLCALLRALVAITVTARSRMMGWRATTRQPSRVATNCLHCSSCSQVEKDVSIANLALAGFLA